MNYLFSSSTKVKKSCSCYLPTPKQKSWLMSVSRVQTINAYYYLIIIYFLKVMKLKKTHWRPISTLAWSHTQNDLDYLRNNLILCYNCRSGTNQELSSQLRVVRGGTGTVCDSPLPGSLPGPQAQPEAICRALASRNSHVQSYSRYDRWPSCLHRRKLFQSSVVI